MGGQLHINDPSAFITDQLLEDPEEIKCRVIPIRPWFGKNRTPAGDRERERDTISLTLHVRSDCDNEKKARQENTTRCPKEKKNPKKTPLKRDMKMRERTCSMALRP